MSQGEDVPSDDGYVPLRYGRLAERLTSEGHSVTRVSPSFSHFRKAQRPATESQSAEGRHIVIPTTSYESSVSKGRAVFTRQLLGGTRRFLIEERDRTDAVLVGMPPPGAVLTARLALRGSTPILADVRDLWPDAFAVGEREKFARPAAFAGKLFSQETRLADRVIAVTGPMLEWVPVSHRYEMIPIGMGERSLETDRLPAKEAPLRACFLSNHTHGFDFAPVLDAWSAYVAELDDPTGAELLFIGQPPTDVAIVERAAADPSIVFRGKAMPRDVAGILSECDIGLAPSLPEWSMSVGNKIFDYLALGLVVFHCIAESETAEFDAAGMGYRLPLEMPSWLSSFRSLHDSRVTLRLARLDRIESAQKMFGASATTAALSDALLGMINR